MHSGLTDFHEDGRRNSFLNLPAISSNRIHLVDEVEGYLTYSTSDGGVGLVKVTQELDEDTITTFTSKYKLALRVECVEKDVFALAADLTSDSIEVGAW